MKRPKSKIQLNTKFKNFWNETVNRFTMEQLLSTSPNIDIAIMGAGFTGLWTAYYLIKHDPTLNIIILEKDGIGSGASGRNGGWCSSKFPISPDVSVERYGIENTRNLYKEMNDTLSEIENVINKENLNVNWTNDGS